MNDVGQCLEQTHLPKADLRFNVELTDPVTAFLDDESDWKGVAGEYVVSIVILSCACWVPFVVRESKTCPPRQDCSWQVRTVRLQVL